MKRWVLALLVGLSLVAWAASQEVVVKPIDDPDYWIGLIDGFKLDSVVDGPRAVSLELCKTGIATAAEAVAEAAEKGRLWWDTRIGEFYARGWVDREDGEPQFMRINPDHPDHIDDHEIAVTMTHEGLHWAYGAAHSLVDPLVKCIVREDEEEDDPDSGEGGGGTDGGGEEPVCKEEPVEVTYTVYELEWEPGTVCLASDDVDDATWCGEGRWVAVPKQKVKWETQTVCYN